VFEVAFDDELVEVQKLVGIADDAGVLQRNCSASHPPQLLCSCLADPFFNGPTSSTSYVEVSSRVLAGMSCVARGAVCAGRGAGKRMRWD